MATRMLQRRGTAAQWSTANPVLGDGEIGFEKDTGVIKVGDGTTAWGALTSAYVRRAGGDVIKSSAAAVRTLALQIATGQSANVLEVLAADGTTVLGRIDTAGEHYVGVNRLAKVSELPTVSTTAPISPAVNDLWIDIS